jgi:hypothetical protein
MAKPNLALIPATIGDKVYSILPSDGVGDFDFDRGTIATRINAQGLIETVASGENRLNYSLLDGEVVGCPHLLLENSATNLITYSEDFSNSSWIKNQVVVNYNNIISPDGTQNASKITINGSTPYLETPLNITLDNTYTISCFVKKGTNKWVRLVYVSSGVTGAWFDLENNVVGTQSSNSISASIENYGNDWYRITNTITSHQASGNVFIGLSDADGGTSSTQVGNTVYVWGFQVEEQSFSTSYIKSNSGSPTTRAAETCDGSGNADTFNDSEGVLMAEISVFDNDTSNRDIYLSDGTANNRIRLRFNSSNNLDILLYNGSIQVSTTQVISDATNFNKIAFKYKANDFALWVNGIEVFTEPSGTVCSGLNDLSFWATYVSSNNFYGNTKQLQYFDSILDSEQLEQLTSWDSFRAMAEAQSYTIE